MNQMIFYRNYVYKIITNSIIFMISKKTIISMIVKIIIKLHNLEMIISSSLHRLESAIREEKENRKRIKGSKRRRIHLRIRVPRIVATVADPAVISDASNVHVEERPSEHFKGRDSNKYFSRSRILEKDCAQNME